MCHFLAVILPQQADCEAVGALAKQHGLGWRRFEPNWQRSPEVEASAFLTAVGHCDCGTAIGAALRPQEPDRVRNAEREEHRLRRKGFSRAKIERALADKQRALRREASSAQRADGDELLRWHDFVHTSVRGGATPWLGLLLHWFSEDVTTERFAIRSEVSVRLSTLTPELLAETEEDVSYRFVS